MGNSGSRGSGGGSGSSSNTGSYTCKSQGGRSWKDNDGVTNICIRGSSTGNSGNNSSGSYPSGNSNSRGGEGRVGSSGSSSTNQESSSQNTYSSGDNYVIQELTTNLNKWQNLSYIDFSGKQLGDDSGKQFNKAFRDAKLPNLLTLVLANNQISDSGAQYLVYSLIHHYNNNLTTLILANNNLTNNGVTPFADGFNQINTTTFPNGAISRGQITKLKYLDLRGNSKIALSGKLYFFKDIAKSKTKDTSIFFDEFTINTGDIHSLSSSNNLLNDSHIPWITGAFHLKWLVSIHNLNLSNNQIGDDGTRLLANSLTSGDMPNLKTLRLEGNNITDEGMNYFPFAIDKMNQDIKVTLLDLYNESKKGMYKNYHLSPLGDKQIKKEILTNYLEVARNLGLDVDNIAIDRTTWGFIKNKVKVSTSFLVGFAKCLIPKDGKELLTDMAIEKNPKIIKKSMVYIQNASCFDEALDKSRLTEEGIALTKYELDVIGNINYNENLYEDVLIKVGEFFDAL